MGDMELVKGEVNACDTANKKSVEQKEFLESFGFLVQCSSPRGVICFDINKNISKLENIMIEGKFTSHFDLEHDTVTIRTIIIIFRFFKSRHFILIQSISSIHLQGKSCMEYVYEVRKD